VTGAGRVQVGGLGIEVLDLPAPPGVAGSVGSFGSPGSSGSSGQGGRAPLVLLHEGLGSVGLWRGFPAALHGATGRRLIAFSRYGHGRSAPPPRARTPAFFHEEALEVLPELFAALGVVDPVLVGHSDGASIAVIYAAHQPVSALVLLAPHVFVEDVTVQSIRQTREAYLTGGMRERMARHHDDPDAAFWGWCDVWLDPAFREWRLGREAALLSAPALLIQGADDPYGSLDQLALIERCSRGPVKRLVLSGGHSPHLEHERRVAQAVAEFLAQLPGNP
jgi:pimeloyl-ACP methyl ester carboxylesterase